MEAESWNFSHQNETFLGMMAASREDLHSLHLVTTIIKHATHYNLSPTTSHIPSTDKNYTNNTTNNNNNNK